MKPSTASDIPFPEDIPVDTATKLLRLGLGGRRRPVDDLIDRLHEADGAAWLSRALNAGPLHGIGAADAMLLEGKASVATLAAIKERSKVILERPRDREERLAGLAGYFLSIAAGLRHHGKVIGGRGREERDAVFLDLAAAAPPAWSEMLGAATMARAGDEA